MNTKNSGIFIVREENIFYIFSSTNLGAWWLGWIVFGVAMMILAGLIAMFPENLKTVEDSERNSKAKGVSAEMIEKEVSFKTKFGKKFNNLCHNSRYNIPVGEINFCSFVVCP